MDGKDDKNVLGAQGATEDVAAGSIVPTDSASHAERFFNLMREYDVADDEMCQALLKAFGHEDWEQFPWPFGGIVYDDYDDSFELRGIKSNDWEPTREQFNAAFALGFYRCWVCYPDGTESYHTRDGSGARQKVAHERKQGDWSETERRLKKRIADLEAMFATGNPASSSEIGSVPSAAPKEPS